MMTDTSQGEFAANVTDARLRHPWVHVNRVLRVMLHTRWSAKSWSVVRVEFMRTLAVRSEIYAHDSAR